MCLHFLQIGGKTEQRFAGVKNGFSMHSHYFIKVAARLNIIVASSGFHDTHKKVESHWVEEGYSIPGKPLAPK